jgi:GDP-4-dehydro-6-deoxy-D-mannose reductase
MAEVLDQLVAPAVTPVTTEVDPHRVRPVELPVQEGSFAKLEATTGWRPGIALESTLADVLEDARRRHGLGVRAAGRSMG